MGSPNGGVSDWTGVTPHFSVGEVVARRYRIERLIRQDLYGSLYQVRHTRYGQAVLLKVFHPFHFSTDADFERLKENFAQAKALRHPGTVRYLEVGQVGTHCYVTMDQIEGKSLRQLLDEYLQSGMVLSLVEAKRFILTILEILTSLEGVPHGNLSPENIILPAQVRPGLMGETSDIRLADFALLDVNAVATADLELAPDDEIAYAPHERIERGGGANAQGDVFSVAAVFFEMLTGRRPPREDLPLPSTIRPDIPEEYDVLMEACLDREPGIRIKTPAAMADRLSLLADEIHEDDIQIRNPRRVLLLLVALFVTILAGGSAHYATQDIELTPQQQMMDVAVRLLNEARTGSVADTPEVLRSHQKAAPKGMAYIPAGTFVKGYLPTEQIKAKELGEPLFSSFEKTGEVVKLEGFYIDRYDAPNQKGKVATVDTSWDEAKAACEDQGKRLCRSDEWERACKGPSSDVYPYGNDYDATACPPSRKKGYKLGAYPACTNDFKVQDMAGATFEWTATESPEGSHGHLVKGGDTGGDLRGHRCSFTRHEMNTTRSSYISYRCCQDLK